MCSRSINFDSESIETPLFKFRFNQQLTLELVSAENLHQLLHRPSQTNLALLTSNTHDAFNSGSSGHVLVTSRIVFDQWTNRSSSVMIDCFDDQESIRFLEISLNGINEIDSLDSLEGITYTGPTKESQVWLNYCT